MLASGYRHEGSIRVRRSIELPDWTPFNCWKRPEAYSGGFPEAGQAQESCFSFVCEIHRKRLWVTKRFLPIQPPKMGQGNARRFYLNSLLLSLDNILYISATFPPLLRRQSPLDASCPSPLHSSLNLPWYLLWLPSKGGVFVGQGEPC